MGGTYSALVAVSDDEIVEDMGAVVTTDCIEDVLGNVADGSVAATAEESPDVFVR